MRFKLKYGPDEADDEPRCNELQGNDDRDMLLALTHLKYSLDYGSENGTHWNVINYYKMFHIKGNGWVLIDEIIPGG